MAITVGLIIDHQSTSDVMSSVLTDAPLSISTSHAHTYEEAGQLIALNQCDIYLIDMTIGRDKSLDLINFIASKSKPCIALSDKEDITLIKKALKVGSRGYLSKSSATNHLVTAISSVLEGQTFIDKATANSIYEHMNMDANLQMRA